MDSLFISPSKNILVNIEHQSKISKRIMIRNLRYYTNTKHKYKKEIQQHIFHTGREIAPKYYIYDNQILHIPYLKQTFERNGMETFKLIKNKLKYNKKILPSDIFDLIWLPHFSELNINDDFLKEYVDTIHLLGKNKFYPLLEKTTVGWIDRLAKNEKTINYMKEKLNMMSINSPEFRDLRATAIYEKEMEIRENKIKEKDNEIKELKKEIEKLKQSIE